SLSSTEKSGRFVVVKSTEVSDANEADTINNVNPMTENEKVPLQAGPTVDCSLKLNESIYE
ncbi:unnamed protein product, partial [Rotaria magnacalcarata]